MLSWYGDVLGQVCISRWSLLKSVLLNGSKCILTYNCLVRSLKIILKKTFFNGPDCR